MFGKPCLSFSICKVALRWPPLQWRLMMLGKVKNNYSSAWMWDGSPGIACPCVDWSLHSQLLIASFGWRQDYQYSWPAETLNATSRAKKGRKTEAVSPQGPPRFFSVSCVMHACMCLRNGHASLSQRCLRTSVVRTWRSWNPWTVLMGMWNGAATVGKRFDSSSKS